MQKYLYLFLLYYKQYTKKKMTIILKIIQQSTLTNFIIRDNMSRNRKTNRKK